MKYAPNDLSKLHNIDVAFFALPHGQALSLITQLPENVKVIDLSGDFRINDADIFKEFYKLEHTAMDLQKSFVYGLTETNRESIKTAKYIANPGCFATATLLALAPLVSQSPNSSNKLQFVDALNKGDARRDGESNKLKFVGRLNGKIIVDAKTGSSGSGAKAAVNTHHPQRMNSFYAYKPFVHQHVPEITQHLKTVGEFENEFVFMTHSLPVSRGIFASCYLEVSEELTTEELKNFYESYYHPSKTKGRSPCVSNGEEPSIESTNLPGEISESSSAPLLTRGLLPRDKRDSFFVRIVDNSPDINWVKTTNFCDIAVHANGKQIVVFSALDNLVKGAAGQAVQNMNLMFGLDETTGLILIGTNP